jgi:hypothetical protein
VNRRDVVPKKGALSALREVVVPTPLVPMIIPIRHVILAVVATKIARARLKILTLVLVKKYVRKAAIVAMLVPVHATREVR